MAFAHAGLRASLLIATFSLAASAAVDGEAVYAKRCAVCHEQFNDRIPTRAALKLMTARRVLRALDFGAMITIANPMNREEREAVAKWLGTPGEDVPPPASAFCSDRTVKVNDKAKFSWNGWSPDGDNARFQTAAEAGLNIEQVKKLKLKWAYAFDGDVTAFAPPAFLDGQIFVGSAGGMIQAMRAETGCLQWIYQARGPVRMAIKVVPNGKTHALLFGDQTGWYYSLEAETGKLNWTKRLDDHDTTRLTASPVVNDGIVYAPIASWEETRSSNPDYVCCTFRGSLVAMKISDGTQVWKSYMMDAPKESGKTETGKLKMGPSGASIWSAPTLDLKRKLIYVTTGDNFSNPATKTSDALVAIELATGKIAWSSQVTENDVSPSEKGPDYDFGSSAMMLKTPQGRDILVAGQKSGMVHAFDPDKKGAILWQERVGNGGSNGGVQWGTASDGQKIYASVSDRAFTRGAAGPDGRPARILDPAVGGGLTAIHLDGSKAWFIPAATCTTPGCSPAQSAALTAIPGAIFSGSLDGHIRAYAAEDGKVLWDFDTIRDYQTVNGAKGKGGAIDGAGPVIVNGMVFVSSGYPRFGGLPGNVLLAFTPDGK
jgi:polyvinyl alcohol dehydrogenase (cytochrome)